jgi:TetR/AcrR family transcriptional regulator
MTAGKAARTRATRVARTPPRRHVPGEERRRQILDVAAGFFARRGFAGTTTREIAAAAGTSETVLFRHFPTKHDLYEAILDHEVPLASVDRWLDELRAIADRRDDQALFGAVVMAILESFKRDTGYHRLMLFALLEGHEVAQIAQARYTAPIVGFLREYVSRRQSEGAFRRARPEWVVHMLLATAAYYAQWKALGVNPLGMTEREVADQAMLLLAGLQTKE